MSSLAGPTHPTPPAFNRRPLSSHLDASSSSQPAAAVRVQKSAKEKEKEKERKEEVNRKIASQKAISIILRREATKAVIEKKKGVNSKKLLPRTILEALHERITALRWESAVKTDAAVFGAIVGGTSLEERNICANEVVKRNVSGYWIGELGLGDTIADRASLLSAVTDLLPKGKPRQVCGLALPEEVLQGVAAGIDIFDSTYIYHLTLEGFALTFPVNDTQRINCYELSEIGSDLTKINLKATVYRRDASPIVEGCSCYTCQNHTKAYINHLLNVHEMLAHILLEIHNTHHYLGFLRRIREAINEDKFEQFHHQYIKSRRNQQTLAAEVA